MYRTSLHACITVSTVVTLFPLTLTWCLLSCFYWVACGHKWNDPTVQCTDTGQEIIKTTMAYQHKIIQLSGHFRWSSEETKSSSNIIPTCGTVELWKGLMFSPAIGHKHGLWSHVSRGWLWRQNGILREMSYYHFLETSPTKFPQRNTLVPLQMTLQFMCLCVSD